MAMSVGRLVGLSVDNEFQGVKNALKVYVIMKVKCLMHYAMPISILRTMHDIHGTFEA